MWKIQGGEYLHMPFYMVLFLSQIVCRITGIYTDLCQFLWVVEYIGSRTCFGRSGGSCSSPDLLYRMSGRWLPVVHSLLPPYPQQTAPSASVTGRRRWWRINGYNNYICVTLLESASHSTVWDSYRHLKCTHILDTVKHRYNMWVGIQRIQLCYEWIHVITV